MASIDFLYLETLATIISTEVQFVPLLKFNENSTIVRLTMSLSKTTIPGITLIWNVIHTSM